MANRPPQQPSAQNNQKTPEPNHNATIAKWTKAVAVFTLILALASIASDFFIWQQYKVANAIRLDAREQLRAVVASAGIQQTIFSAPDAKPLAYTFLPLFENYGGTRTFSFTGWDSIHVFDGGVPHSQDFSKPWDDITPSSTIIAAGGIVPIGPVGFNQTSALDTIANGGTAILWGHAEYSDIFDPATIHHIDFCYSLTPQPPSPTGAISFVAVPFRANCNGNK